MTEVINKIALSSNDDKRMQSIDLIETYAHGTCKGLICKKEKIKRDNIIKQYETLIMSQMKISKNIIQVGWKFLIILIEY